MESLLSVQFIDLTIKSITMKYVYLVCGILASILTIYFYSDTEAIIGMVCLATYSIMDRLPKVQEPVEETKTSPTFDMDNVSRLEVINHARNSHAVGRILVMNKESEDFTVVDAEFQDGNRTLKIFIS